MYKLLVKNTSLNILGLFLASITFFLLQTGFAFSLKQVLPLLFVWVFVYFTYKLSGMIDLAPGEDYLPAYLVIFTYKIVNVTGAELISAFFLVWGLISLIRLLQEEKKEKVGAIAKISVLFAVATLFSPDAVFMLVFLLLVVVLFFPSLRNFLTVLFSYALVYYLFLAVKLLSGYGPELDFAVLSGIVSKIDIAGNLKGFVDNSTLAMSVRAGESISLALVLIWLFIMAMLAFAALGFVLRNFFKLPVKIRRSFVMIIVFLIFAILINLMFDTHIRITVIVPLSLVSGFYLVKSKLKPWMKDVIVLSVLIVNLLLAI